MTDPKQPLGLTVKLPFSSVDEFVQRYGANVSIGGVYLRSKALKPPGTKVTLDLKLQSGQRLIYAAGEVAFVTGHKGGGVLGLGIRFTSILDEGSKELLGTRIATLPHGKSTEPPLPSNVGPADSSPTALGAPATPQAPAAPPTLSAPSPGALPGGAPQKLSESAGPTIAAPAFEEPKEEPKRVGPIIGIDLGTTNSCAAWVGKNGKPTVLASREGYNTVPSILALNARGKLVIGHPAKGQMLTNPRLTVYGSKRLVGRAFDSPVVQHIKDKFYYEVVADPATGDAAVKLGDRVYTLQQISALILREVREIAQIKIGEPVSRAVITVPAYYNDNQRQAVREAGRLAGLYVERIVNEPTAAALAYGYGRKLAQKVMIYDLGGGTFDASVLELNDNVYEVLSTGGDTFLGGLDFDNAIVAHLLHEFETRHGVKFDGDRVAMQRIVDAAERAKCQLSERTEVRVHVPFVSMAGDKPLDLDVMLTRPKLIELTQALVERTINVCKEVLEARKLQPSQIDELILVGGQSRFPLVHEKVQAFFGKSASKSVHPDEAVALGAALLAHSLTQAESGQVLLIDVLPMAIGVGLPGGRFKPVIERNTPLPAKKEYKLATTRDNQTDLEVTAFQGDSLKAPENEYLGTIKLTDLPRGPKGTVMITVTFELSNECLLKVTARDDVSGREVSATMSTKDTPESLKKKLEAEGSISSPSLPTVGSAAPPKAAGGGFFGWLKKLFGGSKS